MRKIYKYAKDEQEALYMAALYFEKRMHGMSAEDAFRSIADRQQWAILS